MRGILKQFIFRSCCPSAAWLRIYETSFEALNGCLKGFTFKKQFKASKEQFYIIYIPLEIYIVNSSR